METLVSIRWSRPVASHPGGGGGIVTLIGPQAKGWNKILGMGNWGGVGGGGVRPPWLQAWWSQSLDQTSDRSSLVRNPHFFRLSPHFIHLGPHFTHLGPHFIHLGPHFIHLGPHFTHLGPHFIHLGPRFIHLSPHFIHPSSRPISF